MAEITLHEVGPRDGLQNEARPIATADKIRLVDLLTAAGLRRIEVTSFVSARWVPQLADAAEVMAGIARRSGVVYSALTPNLRGYEAARAAQAFVSEEVFNTCDRVGVLIFLSIMEHRVVVLGDSAQEPATVAGLRALPAAAARPRGGLRAAIPDSTAIIGVVR